MLVEQLNELQQKLTNGQPLENTECFALISELWRLKASLASKLIERDAALHESSKIQSDLDEATATIEGLRGELDEMRAIQGLGACPLENRWSNCAVRMRKHAGAS